MAHNLQLKLKFRLVSVFLSLSLLVFAFQNCASVVMNNNSSIHHAIVDTGRVSTVFNKSYINDDSNIDMILIFDNSPSMVEEAAKFRKKLPTFISSLEQRSNLNLALISSNNLKYGVQLSPQELKKGYEQHPIKTNTGDFLDNLIKIIPELVGSGIIREKSQKIIMMFGDGDLLTANGQVSSNDFLTKLGSYLNLKDLTIHSFVGIDNKKETCARQPGTRVSELVMDTKGLTFNICDSDWSESFKSVLENIAHLAKTEFKLPSPPAYDVEVRVDGIVTDAFTIEGSSLILNPSHFTVEKDYLVQAEYIKFIGSYAIKNK